MITIILKISATLLVAGLPMAMIAAQFGSPFPKITNTGDKIAMLGVFMCLLGMLLGLVGCILSIWI
jgi:hypothetical protein